MTKYYDAIKTLINNEMINSAAKTVEENGANVSKGATSIVSSLLGVMLKKGDHLQMKNILEEAGKLNILTHSDQVFEEKPTPDQQRIGDDFLQHLLGDRAADFTAPIAKFANISKVATNRLVSMIAPVVAGFLGNKIVKENKTYNQVLREIKDEKSYFSNNIPGDLFQKFGLGSVLDTESKVSDSTEVKKGKSHWLMWLLVIILLLLLLLGWRSCRKSDTPIIEHRTIPTDTVRRDTLRNTVDTADRNTSEVTLPNGQKLTVYEGGVEKKMIDFLKSDDYKNAKESDLKDKWFEFDNLSFEYGSSTDLTPGARNQVNNIIAILKHYTDAKVRIAGYADKKGSDAANMKVSQERAKTIEKLLEQGGVGNQVVKTEGYGDEFAKHSASDTDAERAEDRDIAIRFVK